MIPYLLNAIFKVNSFPESSPSFWMRSGACDRSDPDVAIKAYSVDNNDVGDVWIGREESPHSWQQEFGDRYPVAFGRLRRSCTNLACDQCRVSLYGRSGICRGPRASGAPRTGAT